MEVYWVWEGEGLVYSSKLLSIVQRAVSVDRNGVACVNTVRSAHNGTGAQTSVMI